MFCACCVSIQDTAGALVSSPLGSTYVNPELIWPAARRQQPAESDGFKSSVVHIEGRGS
jgi:hypothetical protein